MQILYCRNAQPLPADVWAENMARLPPLARAGILRYVRWPDRQATFFGRLLLLRALGLEDRPDVLDQVTWNDYKRPSLTGFPDFNIAHSGDWVVVAVSHGGPVGIDVEQMAAIRLRDFRSILCPEEWRLLHTLEDPVDLFFSIWTKKEAVCKAEGRGLYNALDTVNALGNQVLLEGRLWHLRHVPVRAGYACHLASDREIDTFSLEEVPAVELAGK